MNAAFPLLLRDRPESERQLWARWVLGSHSDQFLPEMVAAVEQLGLPAASPAETYTYTPINLEYSIYSIV